MIHPEEELRRAGRWLDDELEIADIGAHAVVNAFETGAVLLGPLAVPAAAAALFDAVFRRKLRGIKTIGNRTYMQVRGRQVTLTPCVFQNGREAIEVDGLRPWMRYSYQTYIDLTVISKYRMEVFFRRHLTYFVPRNGDVAVTAEMARQLAILLRPKMVRDKHVEHVLALPPDAMP